MSQDPLTCPNKSNHVSGTPAFDRVPCPNGCGIYVRKLPGVTYPTMSQVRRCNQEPQFATVGTPPGETLRFLVTINADKYWTVRLAKNGGGGWLARDKDLVECLKAAAAKLEADRLAQGARP